MICPAATISSSICGMGKPMICSYGIAGEPGYNLAKNHVLTLAGVRGNLSLGAPRGVVTHIVQKCGCLKGIGPQFACASSFPFFEKALRQSVGEICPSHFCVVVVVRPCTSTSSLQAFTSGSPILKLTFRVSHMSNAYRTLGLKPFHYESRV